MSETPRLTALTAVAEETVRPRYVPREHAAGIVHIGLGAFHRAHQAVYTDDALAAKGGDWRIIGISLRSTDTVDALNQQNGLYTVLERGPQGVAVRVIASIAHAIAASRDRGAVMSALTDPAIRIVSLTVSEKAYGIDRAAGTVDANHPAVAADLADPHHPAGVLGLLVEALRQRRAAATPPFTVLCCDNLPDNGQLVKAGVVDLAERVDAELGRWIADNVAFPATMVDRITPASSEETTADVRALIGVEDHAAVETEPFRQWVIEDHFPTGRPAWEAGGAIFVTDVLPYERMKLRMLNGAHSMLAYAGFLAGCTYVRDVMRHRDLAMLVNRHLHAAAATLEPLDGVDFSDYAEALTARFENPTIAHETYQIAMDGTQKLPQRLLQPAEAALAANTDIRPYAFAVAAWMRYCLGVKDDHTPYALRDPLDEIIAAALRPLDRDARALADALHALPGLFPATLT
ncbi:MAG: mannitol dehydrogenase family protein, partial [Alphaproteobacteria bacterium]